MMFNISYIIIKKAQKCTMEVQKMSDVLRGSYSALYLFSEAGGARHARPKKINGGTIYILELKA